MVEPHVQEAPAATRNRRSGGRSARVAARRARLLAGAVGAPAVIIRKIPSYELLDEEALLRLEAHAEWMLREIGIEFRGDEEALRLFRQAGATVTGSRVRFDPGLARALGNV